MEYVEYKDLSDYRKYKTIEYQKLRYNGLLEEFCEEMGWELFDRVPKGYWGIFENVFNESLKFKSKTEWVKSSQSSYNSAHRNDWISECTKHMKTKTNLQPQFKIFINVYILLFQCF